VAEARIARLGGAPIAAVPIRVDGRAGGDRTVFSGGETISHSWASSTLGGGTDIKLQGQGGRFHQHHLWPLTASIGDLEHR
jgi:hypothetical protein